LGLDFIDNRALFLVSLLIYMLGLDFIDNRALFLLIKENVDRASNSPFFSVNLF
jgi:hypothetical protein